MVLDSNNLAAAFSTKVFCTSKYSYTTKYAKTVLMPVGIDTVRFAPSGNRTPRSILFLARMAPAKRPEMLIDALALLTQDGVEFTASFVGSPLPHDKAYYEGLKERARAPGLVSRVTFHPGVPNSQTPNLYRAHETFVNTSPSGMLDKTIFEAAASGCIILSASRDVRDAIGEAVYFANARELSGKLSFFLEEKNEREALREKLGKFAGENDLSRLGIALTRAMRL